MRKLGEKEIKDKNPSPNLQCAQCPQAEPEQLSKALSIPSAWQELESMIPSLPLLSFPAAGQAMELGVQGSLLSEGISSGSKTQRGVRVDSWAPCYGVICGTLVFLLPSILPSVEQAFSLFLPGFLPCIPTATLFPC